MFTETEEEINRELERQLHREYLARTEQYAGALELIRRLSEHLSTVGNKAAKRQLNQMRLKSNEATAAYYAMVDKTMEAQRQKKQSLISNPSCDVVSQHEEPASPRS